MAIIKNHRASFEKLNKLLNLSNGKLSISAIGIKDAKVTVLKTHPKGFKVECLLSKKVEIGKPYDATISFGADKYFLKRLMFNSESFDANNEVKGFRYVYAGEVHTIFSRKQKQHAAFHRLILPIPKNPDLFRYFDTISFRNETLQYNRCLIELTFQKGSFHFYEIHVDDKYFIVIDGLQKQAFRIFYQSAYLMLVSYGFITSCFYQEDGYYLTSQNKDFAKIDFVFYYELRDSLISNYALIYTNAYSYLENNTKLASKIQPTLKTLSSKVLNNLLNKLDENIDFLVSILTIIEGNITSLVLRPACYSVAMERFNKIFLDENEGLKPVQDKAVAKAIRMELQQVVEKYTAHIGENAFNILSKKIANINSPTNRDKLVKPFEILGIALTQNDIEAIDNRNSFLHGLKPQIASEDVPDKKSLEGHYYLSLRLHFLVNRLILKYLGFDGKMINYVKLHEHVTGIKVAEDIFVNV